ncbi:MAG: MGMT family protein [Candidatus Hodarchaeales archaeon]|jgi:methylated-DNA-protein-cysteine methyltransferase-like protein
MAKTFSQRVKTLIKAIPTGKVATYGQIARYAGNPRGARQVAWLLHSSSRKDNLPWHRVVNSKGCISLPSGQGYELQKELLEKEGVSFDETDRIDFTRYLHNFELDSEIEDFLV